MKHKKALLHNLKEMSMMLEVRIHEDTELLELMEDHIREMRRNIEAENNGNGGKNGNGALPR